MLNIGRMGPGSERYYLDAVARDGAVRDGVADYYLARGEVPGRWLGRAADGFGLDGEVTAEQLSRMLEGRDPASGELLGTHPARKVPGFDLTFRAPKSVSLLWALSGPTTSVEVAAAHDTAVRAAIDYLERNAGWTRRGAGGGERVRTTGFVGAAFRHRTSRAGDPLLHTHVLVANLAAAVDDGQWRTLDSRQLYLYARTAGFLYQAHLRHELARRTGAAWGPVTNGYADLAAVERDWIDAFSKRRAAVVEHMAARGESSARAAQIATLETRQAKPVQPSEADLRARWQAEAESIGIDADWAYRVLGQAGPEQPDLARLYRDLVTDEALTDDRSTFTRRDTVRAVAERLPAGAPATAVEELADAIIDHDPARVIPLGATRGHLTGLEAIRRTDGTVVPADTDEPRFTTRGLLLIEQHAISHATGRQDAGVATVPSSVVRAAIRQRTLSDEQAAMVRQLTRSGHGVEVVVGKAGTGKTYALDAAREAWTAAGIRMTGVALAARAALELQDSAGIPSTTLARLLRACEDDRVGSPLQPGSVLVVDEAGMVGSRQLARLLAHAEARDVKVVLVGDPHQLPEIDAGGLFRALATRVPTLELTHNRRQQNSWEADALDELRHGDPADAVDRYRQHGRLVTADTAEAIREQLVTDWWEAYDHRSPGSAVMVALRRSDVADLNQRARARLRTAGLLTGPTLDVDGTQLQGGDRILCLRNDRRLGVVNGTQATVATIDGDRGLTVVTDDNRTLTVPSEYLDAGHVTHGYAITGHKAQGLTVDHTLVLGSEALYREWGYVGLSRGRNSNRLYVHTVVDDTEWHRHGRQPEMDPVASTVAHLSRSRAQSPVTNTLAAEWRELQAFLDRDDVRQQPHVLAGRSMLVTERDAVVGHLEELHARRERWLGPAVRRRTRAERDHIANEIARQTERLAGLDARLADAAQRLAGMPRSEQIARTQTRHRQLTEQLRKAVNRRVEEVTANPPGYLVRSIGPAPRNPEARTRWQLLAHAIEDYRTRWDVTDATRPLGTEPRDPAQRSARSRAVNELERLTRDPAHERTRHRTRGMVR